MHSGFPVPLNQGVALVCSRVLFAALFVRDDNPERANGISLPLQLPQGSKTSCIRKGSFQRTRQQHCRHPSRGKGKPNGTPTDTSRHRPLAPRPSTWLPVAKTPRPGSLRRLGYVQRKSLALHRHVEVRRRGVLGDMTSGFARRYHRRPQIAGSRVGRAGALGRLVALKFPQKLEKFQIRITASLYNGNSTSV